MEKKRSTWSSRRATWQYPAAPTPRILNLPTRHPRKKRSQVHHLPKQQPPESAKKIRGKLAALFERERAFARDSNPIVTILGEARRPRVLEEERIVSENPWRFQADFLRAECNLLRMQREATLKKIERKGIHLQKAINSAIQILLVGKDELADNENMAVAVEYQILKLEKLEQKLILKLNTSPIRECSGCCRVMVNRVVEQVKAESEHWSEMQQMVEHVKCQVNRLRRSRDYWEQRTILAHSHLKTLRSSAKAWKNAALQNQLLVKQLQTEVKELKAAKLPGFQGKQRRPLGDITNTNFPRRESLYHHRPSP